MRLRRTLLALALAAVPLGAATANAQTAPPNPGDFIVAMQPPGAPPTDPPDCTPSLTTLGPTTSFPVTAVCTDDTSATGQTQTGTVSNPTLAASTGDAGFSSGTITALCDAKQNIAMTLVITQTGSTMQKFGGTFFQACSFRMAFPDAAQSTLLGTIEANGRLGNADGTVVNNAAQVAIDAKVYVTGGTGAFAGYVGSGSFSQTETIDLSTPQNQGGGTNPLAAFCAANGITDCTQAGVTTWCSNPANAATCASLPRSTRQAAAGNDTMKLRLVKKAGTARILSPAPPAGTPRVAAKVKASTRVKLTATTGARCTVKSNVGKVVGSGTAKGTYGTVTIRPKAGAYAGARSIQATCTTKAGKKVISNRVKIRLG